MSKNKRAANGYIWGEDNLKFANPKHYKKIRQAKNIMEAERYFHSVYHGPSHAYNLTREIFRLSTQVRSKKTVKTYLHFDDIVYSEDENVKISVSHSEKNRGVNATMLADIEASQQHRSLPDSFVGFKLLLKSLIELCDTEDELKYLAFILVYENLDKYIDDDKDEDFNELKGYITDVYNIVKSKKNVTKGCAEKWFGNRYRFDKLTQRLGEKITQKFGQLINLCHLEGIWKK